jgi:hypothetical protein
MSSAQLIIEICPHEPRASVCTIDGQSIQGTEFEEDLHDCTTTGDCEDACRYILDHIGVEFRIVALDENGKYKNRPATDKEKQETCENVYFDSETDFSDMDIAHIYLVWEAANSEEYDNC